MADEQDQEQKTEQPTAKKLSQARESGNLPISKEVGNWFLFMGIVVVGAMIVPLLGETLYTKLRIFIEKPAQMQLGDAGVQKLLIDTFLVIGVPILAIFMILVMAVIAGTLTQTGFYASAAPLKFSWEKLSPIKGLKNLLSKTALVELLKGILKLGVMGYLAYLLMRPTVLSMPQMIGEDLEKFGDKLLAKSFALLLGLMAIVTLIAALDWVYRRYDYFKNLRMTKQEVKDEVRQSEGDPMIKARLRRIRLEKARKRMMAAVPKADVVLTNPTHYAVALRYDTDSMNAPTVVAKGADYVAQRIRALAEESGVPLIANPPLARALYQTVDVDQEIRPEQYRAVAEIISYVYRLKNRRLS